MLRTGWNLVGNPRSVPMTWSNTNLKVRYYQTNMTPGSFPFDVPFGAYVERPLYDGTQWLAHHGWLYNTTTRSYQLVSDRTTFPSATDQVPAFAGFWIRALVDCELVIP